MKEDLPYLVRVNPIIVIFAILLFVVTPFLVWANYTYIHQLSRASGNVITASKAQEIQSANDGVIEDIFVQEGDHVRKGDQIIILEKEQFQAGFDSIESKVAGLRATIARLNAEVYGGEPLFDDLVKKYPEFVNTQTELFHKRKRAHQDEIASLQKSLHIVQQELRLNKPLVASGDIGATEVLKLERQVAELQGQVINKRNQYFQDSQAELTKAEEELSSKEQELTDKKVSLQRTVITAHMDAIVNNIVLTTKGARVRAGDVILQLIPLNDELIMEVKLKPADLSFVQVGQKAIIKLDAYDFSIYGGFEGKVKHISYDSLTEKTNQGEEFYFKVLVALDSHELVSKIGKIVKVTPGMTAQVEIITGERSVLNYLTKPLIKTLSEAMTER